jgi:membrane protease YdiL (CAAX protease family)
VSAPGPIAAYGPRRLWASLTGLAVALIVPALLMSGGPDAAHGSDSPVTDVLVSEACMWTLTLVLLAIVRFWERRPLSSIGLGRPAWSAIGTGGAIAVGLIILASATAALIQASGLPLEGGNEEMVVGLPLPLQLFIALSAGFTEEILFRGYAIERVTELTRSRWLGAIVPIVVFGAVHAPFWGVGHALVAGMSGLWLTLVYLWRRNLWTNIAAHALLDGLVFILIGLDGSFAN